jgi:hypothetical protein
MFKRVEVTAPVDAGDLSTRGFAGMRSALSISVQINTLAMYSIVAD